MSTVVVCTVLVEVWSLVVDMGTSTVDSRLVVVDSAISLDVAVAPVAGRVCMYM